MPGTLTAARLFALVQRLARARNGPVPTVDIIAAVRAAPWSTPSRYQRIFTALIRCRNHGLLHCIKQRSARPDGSRGPARVHWWPVATTYPCASDATATTVREIAQLVDQTIAGLPVGTVIRPGWVVRQTRGVVASCTEAAVAHALQERTAAQRPRLEACTAETGWGGWWRVTEPDSARTRPNRREASAWVFRSIRAAQARTGRHVVELRSLTAGLRGARCAALTRRLRMACHVPADPRVLIMRTPRLIPLGRVRYATYVVPLGEERIGHAELDLDAWWLAATYLQPRHARESRAHTVPGDEVTARGRQAPYAEVLRELHAALATVRDGAAALQWTGESHWTEVATRWLASHPWRMSDADAGAADPVPVTDWISVPAVHCAMHRLLPAHRVPSIRLLRFRLQAAGVWMRPARIIRQPQAERGQQSRAAPAPTMVEAVDAYFWLHSHYLSVSDQAPHRWAWQWLGLARDWDAIRTAAARRPREPWVTLAHTALGAAAAARATFAAR